jgi:hypothetical protein
VKGSTEYIPNLQAILSTDSRKNSLLVEEKYRSEDL